MTCIKTTIKVMNGELQYLGNVQGLNSEIVDLKTENSKLNTRLYRLESEL